MIGFSLAGACSAPAPRDPTPTPSATAPGSSITILGDWDDIAAAFAVAAGTCAWVGVDALDQGADGLVYHLVGRTDEPITVRIQRLAEPHLPDPVMIRVHAAYGRFGHPDQEKQFLDAFRQRLEALRGVDVAPLR
ncbi:MAG: hypothetical protein HRU70_08660 [Phycisphaeraceae bacterium]|nr:MAG: hypothetical protein HRU70_08660 [Phycisphaeraceae bacterium]